MKESRWLFGVGSLVWFGVGVLSASLNDIAGMMSFPIAWSEQTIPFYTSATCVTNTGGVSWIVGGKAKGVNNDISNMAQKMQFMEQSYIHLISNEVMQLPGSFPGQYLDSPGMFCSASSQAVYNNVTKRFCYLGANDGSSNAPQCGCCSVEIGSNSNVKCTDLDVLGMCPPVFQSCVVNDHWNKRGLQIGGTSGVASLSNILCFDTMSETYAKKVTTFSDLTTESILDDPNCKYGNLETSAYDMGCDFMPNDYDHSIIVVGGRTMDKAKGSTFLDTIQICKSNGKICQTLPNLVLPVALSGVRVVGLTNCIFIAFGGLDPSGQSHGKTYVGDICEQKWLYTENLPVALSEFSIILGVNSLCLYGGMVDRQLQNIAYCTKLTRNTNTYTTTTGNPASTSTSTPNSVTTSSTSTSTSISISTSTSNPGSTQASKLSSTQTSNPESTSSSSTSLSTSTPNPGSNTDPETTLNLESTANPNLESSSGSNSKLSQQTQMLSNKMYLIILIVVLFVLIVILCCIWGQCVKKKGTDTGISKMLIKSWSIISSRPNKSTEAEKSMSVVMTSTTHIPRRKHPTEEVQVVCTDGTNLR